MANDKRYASRVYDISGHLELVKGEATSNWSGSTDVSNLTTSATHLTGANAIIFDKDGTTEAFGEITKTLNGKNGNLFALERARLLVNLTSLTDVASISLEIGTDASNNNVYTVSDTELSTGWNKVTFDCSSPTSVTGNGVNWYEINYLAVKVTLDGASDTLTEIIVDSVKLYKANDTSQGDSDNPIVVKQSEIPQAEDNTDGVYGIVKKPLATNTYKGTRYQNNSFTTVNVKASAGTLLYACLHNTTGSTVYFQVHNTATTPAGGATALAKFTVPANSMVILDRESLGVDGLYADTGIAIAGSTALSTYTAVTAGDLVVDLNYL